MQTQFSRFYDVTIVYTGQGAWQDRVLGHLGPGEPGTLRPLREVLGVAHELGCRTVVIEPEYVDVDYLDEFAEHYCKVFVPHRAKCWRLHFFGERVRRGDFLGGLERKHYLGFSVVRPTFSFRTGRTVLESPCQDGDSMFTLCKVPFDVNLLGTNLVVEGMPYIQQETNVGVCAEAALWMTALYMHRKYGYPRYMPSELTDMATKSLTIGPPREGLFHHQMLAALREIGFAPRMFVSYDPMLTARTTYAYVESELPVIIALKVRPRVGHAVTAIGHDFTIRDSLAEDWDSNVAWIDRFYIHDDAVRPYGDLPFEEEPGALYSLQKVQYVIVPTPRDVTMHADDVFLHIDTLKDRLNELLKTADPHRPEALIPEGDLKGLVFRTYLRRSNDFKSDLPVAMSEKFRHVYRSMRMPRYVWITEISRAGYLNVPRAKERKRLGEIVIDSTADRHASLRSYLAIHFLGRLIARSEDDLDLHLDPQEKPYGHLVRGPA